MRVAATLGVVAGLALARDRSRPEEVRSGAVFWLPQSESAEVLDFFERILRGG